MLWPPSQRPRWCRRRRSWRCAVPGATRVGAAGAAETWGGAGTKQRDDLPPTSRRPALRRRRHEELTSCLKLHCHRCNHDDAVSLPAMGSDRVSPSNIQENPSSSSSSFFIHFSSVSSCLSRCPPLFSSPGRSWGAPPADRSNRLPSEWTNLPLQTEDIWSLIGQEDFTCCWPVTSR